MTTHKQFRNIFMNLMIFTSLMVFIISHGLPRHILAFAIPLLCGFMAMYFHIKHEKTPS